MDVLPFTALRFRGAGDTTEVSISYGRFTFRLPADARVEILTPFARLEPVRDRAMVGEVFVGAGLMGLKMTEGSLHVKPLANERQPMLARLEPVFLPTRPATSGAYFSTDPVPPAPADAKGVFAPSGESIGYVGPDGKLVIQPGFTNDLTHPFSPKLVQMAMAKTPTNGRSDEIVPLFDVNGGYVGSLSGPMFYAQTGQPTTPASDTAATRGLSGATGAIGAIGAVGAGSVAGLAVGIAAGGDASLRLGDAPRPASRPCPPRNPHCR
jgi:hypothetical protein